MQGCYQGKCVLEGGLGGDNYEKGAWQLAPALGVLQKRGLGVWELPCVGGHGTKMDNREAHSPTNVCGCHGVLPLNAIPQGEQTSFPSAFWAFTSSTV